jgi:Rieske Fe-S protein
VLAVVATGGVVAAGALIATKLPFFHMGEVAQATTTTTTKTAMTAQVPQKATTQPKPTAPPQKQVTKPQQNAPAHTGTVIGSNTLLVNSAQPFLNPTDGKSSLLIHLPDNNFVAFKQACTHEGVNVNYDPGTHTLICPAHGAIFDPTKNGAVLQGPAMTPLPKVGVQVNTDGTVTTL